MLSLLELGTAGNKSIQPLTVTVNDVKESTLLIKRPSGDPGESSATKAILENKTDVYTFAANDFVTWSLSGGTDKDLFSINSSTGALTLIAPDYESPSDTIKIILMWLMSLQLIISIL